MKRKKSTTKSYSSLDEIFVALAEQLEPPERISVAQCAEKYRFVYQPGAYIGDWQNATTPYMVEPMNVAASRDYTGLVFVGPAQSGKTDALVINFALYTIAVDPMDMMIVCPTQTAARDFSMRRLDRLNRHTDAAGSRLMPSADADNKFDKQYDNGIILSLSWPTPTELAGKPIGRIVLTDRDRMPDDVEGDGEPFDLASKRTTTFGSYAMTIVESSPSREVENLKWIPSSPHEAPPAAGILALYNRGDRRRLYWSCPRCFNYFEGQFEHLVYEREKGKSNMDVAESTRMRCPHCTGLIHPDERDDMLQWSLWVKDNQGIDRHGRRFGDAPRTRIASFWLRGVAARFVSWKALVAMYLDALDDFERTGNEEALKKFYNNDLAEPYYSKSNADTRLPEALKSRADDLGERVVPEGVRFLVATVDVQKNMFVAQVYGVMPGRPFDAVLIDRFEINKSKRLDHDGERLWVKPHAYLEDWDELIEHVIHKEYPLGDGSGRMMRIRQVGCDSGGREGVTMKAYEFWRSLRERNLHRRFILLKGDPTPGQPRTRITTPDSQRKDQKSAARGDIPVLMLNSNLLKDALNGRLDCIEPGKGMLHFPSWLPDKVYVELCTEYRDPKKGWLAPDNHRRNEAWDLSYYFLGLCVSELMMVEQIDWNNPPGWAKPWDSNDLVRAAEAAPRFASEPSEAYDFAEFAKALA